MKLRYSTPATILSLVSGFIASNVLISVLCFSAAIFWVSDIYQYVKNT